MQLNEESANAFIKRLEAKKSQGTRIAPKPESENGEAAPRSPVSYRRLSDVEAKPIDWLWKGRIARGKLTILAGNPGLGKSQLTANLAATVTREANGL